MAATTLNDNLQLNAPKPLDNKYYKSGLTPYASVAEANATIVSAYRYRGLTVAILDGGTLVEYWWFAGTANENLIVKDLGQVPDTRTITTLPTISGGGDLSSNLTLAVVDNTNIQQVNVRYNSTGSPIGTRSTLNIIPGTNVTVSVVDDDPNDQVNITINAAGATAGAQIEQTSVAIAVASFTISVPASIGADGVFPAWVFPTPLFTSTSNASPAVDEVYANLTTGLWTFGTQLEIGQKVTLIWYRN